MSDEWTGTLFVLATIAMFPVTLGATALLMNATGMRSLGAKLDEAARVRREGRASTAVVKSLKPTGSTTNDYPIMEVTLALSPPDQAPYEACSIWVARELEAPRVEPGVTVPVAVDPADPQKVAMLPLPPA
jgi:hypothetical protein